MLTRSWIFLPFAQSDRVWIGGIYASASATDNEIDLKLPIIADAKIRCTGSNAFSTWFVAVGDSMTGATVALYKVGV